MVDIHCVWNSERRAKLHAKKLKEKYKKVKITKKKIGVEILYREMFVVEASDEMTQEEIKKFKKKKTTKKKQEEKCFVSFDGFKSSKVIVLKNRERDWGHFRFGLAKAKLILKNLEEIKKFVEEEG